MKRTVGQMLAARAPDQFAGRRCELDTLAACLGEDGPIVTYVHGIAGIGKSALLDAAYREARTRGVFTIRLNGSSVEPSQDGLLRSLGGTTLEDVASEISRTGEVTAVLIDEYDSLRIQDAWIREVLIPALPGSVRFVFSGRLPPPSAWFTSLGWHGLFRDFPLGPLASGDALALLKGMDVTGSPARSAQRIAKGHPLALRLAAHALRNHPADEIERSAASAVIQQLSEMYLRDVDDAAARGALEAASVVRRVTVPLLTAMLPGADPQRLYRSLAGMPFAETTDEGVLIHESVRDAVATSLRAADPARHREYRRAAWQSLYAGLHDGGGEDWRRMADIIYLLNNPNVRQAFFPEGSNRTVVTSASPADESAIFAIAAKHEPAETVAVMKRWWERQPTAFRVTRSETGCVDGFYVLFEFDEVANRTVPSDPVAAKWYEHLRARPLPERQTAVLLRRWLSDEHGEEPSRVQSACWLDVKRIYVNLRTRLRRCYIVVCDLAPYAQAAQRLGFEPVPGGPVSIGANAYHLAVLDFGAGSVDGWISGMVATELELSRFDLIDPETRELIAGGRRTPLTAMEFGLLRHLAERGGRPVTRVDLLCEVWGQRFHEGSNVVDVVVRAVRKKLGSEAWRIETVRGLGYRLRSGARR